LTKIYNGVYYKCFNPTEGKLEMLKRIVLVASLVLAGTSFATAGDYAACVANAENGGQVDWCTITSGSGQLPQE
jgi:hypothetical protein